MASRTDLNILDLPSIFRSVADNRRSGTLRVQSGAQEKAVYFKDGHIQACYTPGKLTLLGEALLRAGHIDDDTLERAMIKQKASGEKLGVVLVKQGKITEADLARALQGQISEEVCELFTWKDIHCEFNPGPPPSHFFEPDPISERISILPESLMMEAARRMDELDIIRKTLPSMRDVPVVVKAPVAAPGSPQAEVVSLVDGVRDLDDVVSRVRMGKFKALKTLKILVEQGMLRIKSAQELVATAKDLGEAGERGGAGGVTKVIRLYERAEELGVKNKQISLWLAKAYERTKQKKQSVTRYLALGRESLESGQVEQGISMLRRILDLNPDDTDTHEKMIDALVRKGDADAAVAEVRTLAQRHREAKRAADGLAMAKRASIALGQRPELRELIAELTLEAGDHIQALMEYEALAADLAETGALADAVRLYDKMLAIDRENIDAHFRLAGALTQLGRTDEAVARYKALADMLSSSGVLETSINWQFLITVYEQIVAIEPNNRTAREWLADAYLAKGEREKGIVHLNELVRIRSDAQELKPLIAVLGKVLELQPDNFNARRRLADAHVERGQRAEAVRELRTIGDLARQRGELDVAQRALADAIRIDPYDLEAHASLAELHLAAKRTDDAARAFRDLAHLARLARRPEEAAKWFWRAAETDRLDGRSIAEAAELLAASGDRAGAAAAFRRHVERAIELGNRGDARRGVERLAALGTANGDLAALKQRADAVT